MQPEILILQVDKALRVAQRVYIELCNTLDAWPGVETIGVLWDSPGNLHQALALYRGWERVFGDEEGRYLLYFDAAEMCSNGMAHPSGRNHRSIRSADQCRLRKRRCHPRS